MRHLLVMILIGAGVGCAPDQKQQDLIKDVSNLKTEVEDLQKQIGVLNERKDKGDDLKEAAKRRKAMQARGAKAGGGAAGGGKGPPKMSEAVQGGITLALEGDAKKVVVNAAGDGAHYELPTQVNPGEYGLWASFPEGKAKFIKKIVVADRSMTVTCVGAQKTCTVQ